MRLPDLRHGSEQDCTNGAKQQSPGIVHKPERRILQLETNEKQILEVAQKWEMPKMEPSLG